MNHDHVISKSALYNEVCYKGTAIYFGNKFLKFGKSTIHIYYSKTMKIRTMYFKYYL